MKIIRQGSVKPVQPPWWVGRQVSCANCKTTVEIEEHDTLSRRVSNSRLGLGEVSVTCPVCYGPIIIAPTFDNAVKVEVTP